MNEKNKIRITIVAELCVCVTMIIGFLNNTERVFQVANLLVAMFSMSLAVENHFKLVKFKENE